MVSVLHQASYLRKKELVALDSGKQTTVGSGGFFVYRQQITRRKKGSQEDPLIFSRHVLSHSHSSQFLTTIDSKPETQKIPPPKQVIDRFA
ncbi:hypothetical protein A9U41_23935 [Salmonella enterica subsp. enterica serovar Anatum]|nr:hypothetical protein [Salmonella enterica]EBV6061932.1 hypothetical protein [Salmonella enterica subsp. enterica serovar Saintpaul]EBV6286909.1 hypothetical protein [Salmonella enterica subsp. enterica serovar Hadar]EBV7511809.1 hypothetical protein [Salmonella enterica subsp. enterica serovar Berta]EBW5914468.1 hypothetical protein [Salmonella enterica subsp. enterica serovar Derby]ECA6169088.1 hypothetical protein [Salmonella enterica subsp. enterica serovar Schwarzengrund]ECE0709691.1 h